VQPEKVAQKVFASMYDGMNTSEIDDISADIAINMITENPDYEILSTRILVSNMHKTLPKCFSDSMLFLYNHKVVSEKFIKNMTLEMDTWIDHTRDYKFSYFGLKTLQKMYLNPGETPQYLYMRVALAIHGSDYERVRETYDLMSNHYFIHATPTLFNAGSNRPQMSSCFLQAMKDDSMEGIYDTLKDCSQISKWSGGIGMHIHNIRAKGSKIVGTNGQSDGIIPMLRVFNATARYVNQGGRRKGSIAAYIEPWHADIMDFLELRLNQGDEESRCRDLFTALWIPDLFMLAVKNDADWHLMCPNECPGLSDVWGSKFDDLYYKYVNEGKFREMLPARTVWAAILKSQVETGTPYMLYKDACNSKSNQQNLGTIKSSNLCTEIIEYSDKDETAVCNLASISLPAFIQQGGFAIEKLEEVTRVIVRNLNRVIDENYYPTESARKSNLRHRPIAIGVQGLADAYQMLGYSFDSLEANSMNRMIFESIYFAALVESCKLAKEEGPYESYEGSPASKGLLQPDLWGGSMGSESYFDYKGLREGIAKYGLRNSLLVAPMPTASTSQILGNNECFEPFTSNLYLRRTLAGEFVMINKHLVKDLQKLGKWTKEVKDQIIRDGGSVQDLDIPDKMKLVYRTVWEIPQKSLIDMAADRAPYIDQSQSMNLFMEDPTNAKLSSMHMYTWSKGLKTGMYYLRTRPKAKPIQVTVPVCRMEEGCIMCSS
jgi:ribonucleoside-diphosphate reductase alpha subunit